MHESPLATEEWVPCDPVFLETDDGFVLSPEAQAILAAMDAVEGGSTGSNDVDEKALSTLDEIAVLRAQVDKLAELLPGAVRDLEGHEILDAVRELKPWQTCSPSATKR